MITTTHECPTCGDVHLPLIPPEQKAEPLHEHVPEEQWYISTTDNRKVWLCRDCRMRIESDGREWEP